MIAPLRRTRSVLIAVLATALVLAAAEVVTRSWIASPSISVPDARYGWVYQPHALIVQSTEGWSARRTNSMGLVDDELRVPRARVRAVLLGDSFTEALQVAQDADFESVAEQRMPGLEVVNIGCSGRSPVDYADWIEEQGPRLDPDLVVVQLSDSDLSDLLVPATQERLAAEGGRGANAAPAPPVREGVLARLVRQALRSSALATVVWHRVKPLMVEWRLHPPRPFRQAVAAPDPAPALAGADPRLPGLMDALHRRIAAHAPRLLYLYLPSVDYFRARPGYGEPQAAAFYHAFATRNHVTLVDPIDGLLAEFERTGQPLHGFQNSLPGVGHLNAAGHRVVGERLARAIGEALR